MTRQSERRKRTRRVPNGSAWRLARLWRQTGCAYCRGLFTEQSPPTKDHIDTAGDRSDAMQYAVVLVCQACNNARGNAPYAEYMEAVAAEWARCDETRTPYRRPKYRTVPGGRYTITTESKEAEHARNVEKQAAKQQAMRRQA